MNILLFYVYYKNSIKCILCNIRLCTMDQYVKQFPITSMNMVYRFRNIIIVLLKCFPINRSISRKVLTRIYTVKKLEVLKQRYLKLIRFNNRWFSFSTFLPFRRSLRKTSQPLKVHLTFVSCLILLIFRWEWWSEM